MLFGIDGLFGKKAEERTYSTKDRYLLESQLLPSFVFGENAGSVLTLILKEQGQFFIDLLKKMNKENAGYSCPYQPSMFRAEGIRFPNDLYCVHIVMPKPEREPLCFDIFVFHDQNYENIQYLTIERGNSERQRCICSWNEKGGHSFYGTTEDQGTAVERVFAIAQHE